MRTGGLPTMFMRDDTDLCSQSPRSISWRVVAKPCPPTLIKDNKWRTLCNSHRDKIQSSRSEECSEGSRISLQNSIAMTKQGTSGSVMARNEHEPKAGGPDVIPNPVPVPDPQPPSPDPAPEPAPAPPMPEPQPALKQGHTSLSPVWRRELRSFKTREEALDWLATGSADA